MTTATLDRDYESQYLAEKGACESFGITREKFIWSLKTQAGEDAGEYPTEAKLNNVQSTMTYTKDDEPFVNEFLQNLEMNKSLGLDLPAYIRGARLLAGRDPG